MKDYKPQNHIQSLTMDIINEPYKLKCKNYAIKQIINISRIECAEILWKL